MSTLPPTRGINYLESDSRIKSVNADINQLASVQPLEEGALQRHPGPGREYKVHHPRAQREPLANRRNGGRSGSFHYYRLQFICHSTSIL